MGTFRDRIGGAVGGIGYLLQRGCSSRAVVSYFQYRLEPFVGLAGSYASQLYRGTGKHYLANPGAACGAGWTGRCGSGDGGATYQGLFRNPLADPYLIGVANGASAGAVIALVATLPAAFYSWGIVQWAAFGGALLTVLIVYNLARVAGAVPTTTLLLAGIAVGSLAASVTSLLIYLNSKRLTEIYGWLLGGLNAGNWEQVWSVLPYVRSARACYTFLVVS